MDQEIVTLTLNDVSPGEPAASVGHARAHPERFYRGPPRAPELPDKVWINQTPSKIESEVK